MKAHNIIAEHGRVSAHIPMVIGQISLISWVVGGDSKLITISTQNALFNRSPIHQSVTQTHDTDNKQSKTDAVTDAEDLVRFNVIVTPI